MRLHTESSSWGLELESRVDRRSNGDDRLPREVPLGGFSIAVRLLRAAYSECHVPLMENNEMRTSFHQDDGCCGR